MDSILVFAKTHDNDDANDTNDIRASSNGHFDGQQPMIPCVRSASRRVLLSSVSGYAPQSREWPTRQMFICTSTAHPTHTHTHVWSIALRPSQSIYTHITHTNTCTRYRWPSFWWNCKCCWCPMAMGRQEWRAASNNTAVGQSLVVLLCHVYVSNISIARWHTPLFYRLRSLCVCVCCVYRYGMGALPPCVYTIPKLHLEGDNKSVSFS